MARDQKAPGLKLTFEELYQKVTSILLASLPKEEIQAFQYALDNYPDDIGIVFASITNKIWLGEERATKEERDKQDRRTIANALAATGIRGEQLRQAVEMISARLDVAAKEAVERYLASKRE